MYEITEWDWRYEVNSNASVYEPGSGQKRRARPLDYVRSKVHGRSMGTGMRKLKAAAGDRAMEVFGVFHKFLEIAGDASKGNRGRLLNSDSLDDPATAADLAFILDIPQEQIDYALTTLLNIGWVLGVFGESHETPGTPGNSANSPKTPPLNNETETESKLTELNETSAELTGCELPEGVEEAITHLTEVHDEVIAHLTEGQAKKIIYGEDSDSDLIIKDNSDSDSENIEDSEVTATTSKSFLLRLIILLPRWTPADKTGFENLAEILSDMVDAPNTFGEALVIARECRSNGGDNPKQAFMFRVQKHFDIKLHTPWRSNEAKRKKTIKKAEAKE